MSILPVATAQHPAGYKKSPPSPMPFALLPHNRYVILLVLCCSLVQVTHSSCYNSTGNVTGCSLCLSDDGSMVNSCSFYGNSNDNCPKICCSLDYQVRIPWNCPYVKSPGSGSSVSITTVVVIIIFSVPVLICLLLMVHGCIVGINRTPQQAARARTEHRHPHTEVNLNNYSIQDSFPYQIDPQQACSICLENQCHTITLCGHTYHSQCLRAWLKKRETCPLCVSPQFNPIAVFCTACGRSVRLDTMYGRMSRQKKAEWEQSTRVKCPNCLSQHLEDGIQISIEEEEVERYQAPTLAAVLESQQRVVSESKLESQGKSGGEFN